MLEMPKPTNGIARRTRRRVNLTPRNTTAKPPMSAWRRKTHTAAKKVKKVPATERTIHYRTIPQIAWLKKYDKEEFAEFLESLSGPEKLDIMELESVGGLNLD